MIGIPLIMKYLGVIGLLLIAPAFTAIVWIWTYLSHRLDGRRRYRSMLDDD
ncbi:hypothetical protein ACFL51_00040 [Myxococcota bacterium]